MIHINGWRQSLFVCVLTGLQCLNGYFFWISKKKGIPNSNYLLPIFHLLSCFMCKRGKEACPLLGWHPCQPCGLNYIQWVCTGLLQYFDLIKNGQISETFFCAIFLDEPHLVKNPICRRSPTFSSKTVVDPKLNWASSSAGRSGHLQPSKSVLSSTSMLFNVQYQYEYISHACPRYRSCTVLWSN